MPPETIEEVNNRIIELWSEYENDLTDLQDPLLIPELFEEFDPENDHILFVGLNPSNSSKVFETANKANPNLTKQDLFWTVEKNINVDLLVSTWHDIRERYSYYDTIREYFGYMKNNYPDIEWYHMDLCFFRESKAKKIVEYIKCNNPLDFWNRQLEISRDIVRIIDPLMVIVVNSAASNIMKKAGSVFNSNETDLDFNGESMCWFLNFNNQNNEADRIKTIFTSLFNGHPDRNTKEILKLNLKKILNQSIGES